MDAYTKTHTHMLFECTWKSPCNSCNILQCTAIPHNLGDDAEDAEFGKWKSTCSCCCRYLHTHTDAHTNVSVHVHVSDLLCSGIIPCVGQWSLFSESQLLNENHKLRCAYRIIISGILYLRMRRFQCTVCSRKYLFTHVCMYAIFAYITLNRNFIHRISIGLFSTYRNKNTSCKNVFLEVESGTWHENQSCSDVLQYKISNVRWSFCDTSKHLLVFCTIIHIHILMQWVCTTITRGWFESLKKQNDAGIWHSK